MPGFQPLSSPGLHLLRNDFALLLALLRARLPAAHFRRCLGWQQESDRSLARGAPTVPRQRLEETCGKLQTCFDQLEKDEFSRPDFEQLCFDYRALFAPRAGGRANADE